MSRFLINVTRKANVQERKWGTKSGCWTRSKSDKGPDEGKRTEHSEQLVVGGPGDRGESELVTC